MIMKGDGNGDGRGKIQEDRTKQKENEDENSPPGTISTILSSALAKSLAMLLTYPHQLVRARMQTYNTHPSITSSSNYSEMIKGKVMTVSEAARLDTSKSKAKEKMEEKKKTREEMKRKGGQSISIPRLISSIWRNEGLRGFYKGYAYLSPIPHFFNVCPFIYFPSAYLDSIPRPLSIPL